MYLFFVFRLEDHLYTLHLKQKEKSPILLSSVENILEKALFEILGSLKNHYPKSGNNIVYVTICQKTLVNPIRSGTYHLQDNDLKPLVNHIMAAFNAFLHSGAEIKLDDSFEVYFKVLSNASISYSGHRRKTVPLRQLVGAKTESKILLRGGLIDLPVEFPDKKHSLKNLCLISAVIFNYFKFADPNKYFRIKKMCFATSSKEAKNEAGKLLFEEVESFCLKENVLMEGPHDPLTVLPKLANYFKIQIHLIQSMDGLRKVPLLSFPDGNDLTRFRVYLYLQPNHILLIDNLKQFFNHHKRRICFDCGQFAQFLFRANSHKCHARLNCLRCLGCFKSDSTVKVPNEIIAFCDSKNKNEPLLSCLKCKFVFKSETCFNNHKTACKQNRLKVKCSKCNVYWTSMSKEKSDILKSSHTCGVLPRLCQICKELKVETFHVCKIKKEKIHDSWPNLGFINMKFKFNSSGNCQNCFSIKETFMKANNLSYKELFNHSQFETLICEDHKTIFVKEEPNLISIYTEQKDRLTFKHQLFKEDSIVISPEENDLSFEYCQNAPEMSTNVFKERRSMKEMSKTFYHYLNNVSKEMSPLDKLVLFLCDKKNNLSNFTFVVENNKAMFALLRYFLNVQVVPFIIQQETNIILLEVSGLRIKFILRTSYLKGSAFDIGSQYGVKFEKCFFPDSFNIPRNYNYLSSKPDLKNFLQFVNTPKEIAEIKDFYESLPEEWNFNRELINCFETESLTSVQATLRFLKEAFTLQETLSALTKKPSKAIHPFGGRLISLSGFSFSLFSFYFGNDVDAFTVMNPDVSGQTQTSRPEYEYISWLNFKGVNGFVQGFFNHSEGQKYFGKFPVDGYNSTTKTVYQFRG